MFDIGFSELLLIALVALVVIGPERLPKVARTVGALLGRLQRYVNDVKADINREMQLEELKKLQQQVADQARTMEQSVNAQLSAVETSLNQSIGQGLADKPAEPPVAETAASSLETAVVSTGEALTSSPADAVGEKAKIS